MLIATRMGMFKCRLFGEASIGSVFMHKDSQKGTLSTGYKHGIFLVHVISNT